MKRLAIVWAAEGRHEGRSPVTWRTRDGGRPWRIWIDTGGTFTDCLAVDPGGRLHRAKVLSTSALRGRIAERAGAGRPAV